ncbi:MAG: molybdopterin-guanine dinucleotide biosynthesis protein MobA [Thermoleophilia bacterium]|nr:molybdopterin-guanine dinucleotide biosynthesis protein MobA [Thermoleophilia bacterium]
MEDVEAFAGRAIKALGDDNLQWVAEPATVAALLLLAADAAHGVTRPAAPIATFLAGVTLGQAGGDPAALEGALADIRRAIPT